VPKKKKPASLTNVERDIKNTWSALPARQIPKEAVNARWLELAEIALRPAGHAKREPRASGN
jgi:hypothetical protein